jgi:hypothetical protein
MKTIRKFVSTAVVFSACAFFAALPAHATLEGGSPRPQSVSASTVIAVILTVLGY